MGRDAGTGQWLRAVFPVSRCSEKVRRRRPLVEGTAVACPTNFRERGELDGPAFADAAARQGAAR